MLSFDVYPGHFTLVDMNCLLLCPCYTVLEVFRWGQDFLKQRCCDPSKEILMYWTSFKYGLLGLSINWNYIHNVALEILFWNSLHRRQQRCSFWVSWGLPLISPFFAGLAPIDAGWGPWAVSPGAGGPVAGGSSSSCSTAIWRSWSWRFRSWRSRKQSFRAGAGGDFSGVLRCHSGVEKERVILPSLEVRGRKAIHFTARIQWTHSLPFFTRSCSVAILECQGDILVAEV